jgi:hypothetical protein
MSKTLEDLAGDLKSTYDDQYERFIDSFIQNKARPAVMIYMRDWFDEEVIPALRDSYSDGDQEALANRLGQLFAGLDKGLRAFVQDIDSDPPEPRTPAIEVNEVQGSVSDAKRLMAAIQHATNNHNYPYLNQPLLTRITGIEERTLFRLLNDLENSGYLLRESPEKTPPGIHHRRKAYRVLREVPNAENLIDPDTVAGVMEEVAFDLHQRRQKQHKKKDIKTLLHEFRNVADDVRAAPLEIRRKAEERLAELQAKLSDE